MESEHERAASSLSARLRTALRGRDDLHALLETAVFELAPELDVDICTARVAPHADLPGSAASLVRRGSRPLTAGEEVPDALLAHLSATREAVHLPDAFADSLGVALVPAPGVVKDLARPVSLLAVPLTDGAAVVGALAAVSGGKRQGLSYAAQRAFEDAAVEISLALGGLRLKERERELEDFLDRLREAGRNLVALSDVARVRTVLCEQAGSVLAADAAQLWEAEPTTGFLTLVARWGLAGPPEKSVPMERGELFLVRAYQNGAFAAATEAEAGELFPRGSSAVSPPIVQAAAAPLLSRDGAFNVLAVGRRKTAAGWQRSLERRLPLLADAAAVAIHTAQLAKRLEQQTERDPSTGIFTPPAIGRRLEAELRRAERNGQPISVVNLRIEGLADAVQKLAADLGEPFLAKASAQLVRATRGTDVVGHDRGDRFWLILFDTGKDQVSMAMAAIRKNFQERLDPRLSAGGIRLELTAGVAAYPDDAFETPSLLLRAEEALDDAIKAGPGSTVLYGFYE